MDKQQYIDNLKSLNMRPTKVKVEKKEEFLMENEPKGEGDIIGEIIKWFLANPYPDDDAVHAFSKEMGIDEHDLEKHIYALISSIMSEGNSKGKEIKHDPKELEMGIEVEMEHTTNPLISRKIALDHLTEIPDYYTRLAKMEKEAGVTHHD